MRLVSHELVGHNSITRIQVRASGRPRFIFHSEGSRLVLGTPWWDALNVEFGGEQILSQALMLIAIEC
jgi:hypothetical protein